MKLKFTLTPLLLVFAIAAGAQNLTGIWRGYFSSSSGLYKDDARQELYKYEVQIDQQANNGVKGVTYSYKSTVFYGKATLQGIFSVQTGNLILKETGLEEIKIGDKSEPCLMTCYLEYAKIGKLEVLQGTFISVNVKNKLDCGSGKVYLERVKESDFELEPFLQKKQPATAKKKITEPSSKQPETTTLKLSTLPNSRKDNTTKAPVRINPTPKTSQPAEKKPVNPNTSTPPVTKNNTSKPATSTAQNKTPVKKNTTTVPKQETKTTTASTVPPVAAVQKPDAVVPLKKTDTPIVKWEKPTNMGPIPKVLLERENNLVKTLYTSEHYLTVEIFDNGTIDNDTISLYHNNKLVISNAKLSYTPIRLKIDCSEENKRHELIMVAENLGEIPPNSALMVITAGKKRYEVFLISNEQRNAKIVIEYRVGGVSE